jgi:hypothetical protein
MERAAADQIGAAFFQRHARGFDQPHQAHLGLQPLDLSLRDTGHGRVPLKPVKCKMRQRLDNIYVIMAFSLRRSVKWELG